VERNLRRTPGKVNTAGIEMKKAAKTAKTTKVRPPREITREAVLNAAEAHFRKNGFQAASLDAIAKSAHLTKGAVYSSFRGKDELMLAVLERQVRRNIVRYRTESGSPGGKVTIDSISAFLAERAIEDAPWSTCFAEFALHASRRPRIAKALATMRGKLRDEIVEMLRPLVDEGRAGAARLDIAATVFVALANGLTLERLSDPSRVNAAIFRDALTRLLR
jgi:AcrR family transcriptional regulator